MTTMRLTSLLVALACISLASPSQAQPPQGPGVMPPPGKLYVKFQGEPGVRLSYLEAPGKWKTQPVPVQLALQPGMKYLFKVEGLPHNEGIAFYPALEVFDVL